MSKKKNLGITRSYYPVGDLPKLSQDQLRELANKKQKTTQEQDLIISEANRAQRKRGWLIDSDRPDKVEREASSTGTIRIAGIGELAKEAMNFQGGRSRGGGKRAIQKIINGGKTSLQVLEAYDAMSAPVRSRAAILAGRDGFPSASHIRKIVRKRKAGLS